MFLQELSSQSQNTWLDSLLATHFDFNDRKRRTVNDENDLLFFGCHVLPRKHQLNFLMTKFKETVQGCKKTFFFFFLNLLMTHRYKK